MIILNGRWSSPDHFNFIRGLVNVVELGVLIRVLWEIQFLIWFYMDLSYVSCL